MPRDTGCRRNIPAEAKQREIATLSSRRRCLVNQHVLCIWLYVRIWHGNFPATEPRPCSSLRTSAPTVSSCSIATTVAPT